MTLRRFLSIILAFTMLISIIPLSVFADKPDSNIEDDFNPQELILDPDTMHEVMAYEDAVAAGHIMRMNSDEELNTLVFANPISADTMYIYDENIKYIDDDGNVIDKSNVLVRQSDGSYKNKANDIEVTYPAKISNGIMLTYDELNLQFIPYGNDSTAQSVINAKAAVEYTDVFDDGIDLKYTQTYSGFKGNIIITQKTDVNSFVFLVETNGASLQNSGGAVVVTQNGQTIAELEPVTAYDANGKTSVVTSKIETVEENQTYKLTLILTDTTAAYPITIETALKITESANKVINETAEAVSASNINNSLTAIANNNPELAKPEFLRTTVEFPGLFREGTEFDRLYDAGKVLSIKYCFYDGAHIKREMEIKNHIDDWKDSDAEIGGKLVVESVSTSGIATVSETAAVSANAQNTGSVYAMPYVAVTHNVMPGGETEGIIDGAVYRISSETGPNSISYSGTALSREPTDNTNKDTKQFFQIDYTANGIYQIIPEITDDYTFEGIKAGTKDIPPQKDRQKRFTQSGTDIVINTANSFPTQEWYIRKIGMVFRFETVNGNKIMSAGVNNSVVLNVSDNSTGGVWTLNEIIGPSLNVTLLTQPDQYTCMSACGTMLLQYKGVDVTISQFKTTSDQNAAEYNAQHNLSGTDATNHTWALIVKMTLNDYSDEYNYNYYDGRDYTRNEFAEEIITRINNDHPVIVQCKMSNSSYFPYESNGHAILITGYYYDPSQYDYVAIVKDPHYGYSNTYYIPLTAIYYYTCLKGGRFLTV